MKVGFLNSIYKSNSLKKGLEFVSDNGALFYEGTSLALASVVRPISIYATPKTDKENKKLATAKSIASSLIGFGLMLGVSFPLTRSIRKIDESPEKYLSEKTIANLKETSKPLTASKPYQFATQLFKLGIRTLTAVPKSLIVCALIPPIMSAIFSKKKNVEDTSTQKTKTITKSKKTQPLNFTGRGDYLTRGISKVINNKSLQEFTTKYKDSNYAMHITVAGDVLATSAFAIQTANSKKIESERKKPLINNSVISTTLSILAGYGIDKALDKPTDKFISKFKEANKNYKNLDKCVEGIKIVKPALILGGIYYCAIPLISTFFAERLPNSKVKSDTK